MKFRFLAFLYALAVYLLLAGTAWSLMRRWNLIAEEATSTRVTLVHPDEAKTDAKQVVNSEASQISEVKKVSPDKIVPTPPEPEEQLEPVEEKKTVPPKPPAKKESEKIEKQKTPFHPPARQNTSEALALDEPVARTVPLSDRAEKPPLEPLKPYNPELFKSLKRPLSDSELASCCPSEPKKSVRKRTKSRHEKKSQRHRRKSKTRQSLRSSRNAVHSRARRGGSLSANRFLALIKRRIARNRHYPPTARRRRLQGTVRVSFTVLPGGRVGDIHVSGPRVFASSARQAVRRAFPVRTTRIGFSLPRRLSVTLRYRLH